MKLGYRELIWRSFRKALGGPLAVFGSLVGVVLWAIAPTRSFSIPAWVLVILSMLVVPLLFIFANALFEAVRSNNVTVIDASTLKQNQNRRILPKIVYAKRNEKDLTKVLLLLEPSELFSYGMAVSIYIDEQNLEQFVGVGSVLNIQEDGQIQVTIHYVEYPQIIEDVINDSKSSRLRTKVKPSVPYSYLDLLIRSQP